MMAVKPETPDRDERDGADGLTDLCSLFGGEHGDDQGAVVVSRRHIGTGPPHPATVDIDDTGVGGDAEDLVEQVSVVGQIRRQVGPVQCDTAIEQ
ncbi:hypothetical protein ACFWCF_05300 [Rhodococcus sp. NPDC060090]|uniref:hypothetical protein n=1 Tax=Rhodococcus sp. NPDC060090 TaxID=3347056 RepID=UPI00364A4603